MTSSGLTAIEVLDTSRWRLFVCARENGSAVVANAVTSRGNGLRGAARDFGRVHANGTGTNGRQTKEN